MTKAQWEEFKTLVESFGPEVIEFEAENGEAFDFVDVSYLDENSILVLLI